MIKNEWRVLIRMRLDYAVKRDIYVKYAYHAQLMKTDTHRIIHTVNLFPSPMPVYVIKQRGRETRRVEKKGI